MHVLGKKESSRENVKCVVTRESHVGHRDTAEFLWWQQYREQLDFLSYCLTGQAVAVKTILQPLK